MRASPKRFPAASIERAVSLYLDGVSMSKIGAATGADAKTVRRWVRGAGHELRRPGRPRTHDHAELLKLRERLGSDLATARAFGCHCTTVTRASQRRD